MKPLHYFLLPALGWMLVSTPVFAELTLDRAVSIALQRDPWLAGSQYREQALIDESIAASALPDPLINLTAANFPTNSFDINQEPMTQLVAGLSQRFPRGQTRALSRQQKQELAAQEPLLRRDRQARITEAVTSLWFDAYNAQQSIALINQDRSLFDHLVDATTASYGAGAANARQQDIIRAQLELTRLDDRLSTLQIHLEAAQQHLAEWLGASALETLPADMPALQAPLEVRTDQSADLDYQSIATHPALRAFDKRVQAEALTIELARQKYRPEWGLSAQYGYREDDVAGMSRADLLSVGVSFDLPIFTGNKQDREVAAAQANAEALKTDRLLLARKLLAQRDAALLRLQRLTERRDLYQRQLLPQMAEQAEAALNAYNNDDGDFAEAVRARIAELNAKIDALAIDTSRQQTLAMLRYLSTVEPGPTSRENDTNANTLDHTRAATGGSQP